MELKRRSLLAGLATLLPKAVFGGVVPGDAYYSGSAPSQQDYFSSGGSDVQVAPAVIKRKLTMFSPSWCSGCQQLERALAVENKYDITWNHAEGTFPSWVRDLISTGATYPVMYWEASPGNWIRAYGFNTAEDINKALVSYGNKLPKAESVPKKVMKWACVCLRHGAHWTIGAIQFAMASIGQVRHHLVSVHGHNYAELSSYSKEQLGNMHDAHHEGRSYGNFSFPTTPANGVDKLRRGPFGIFPAKRAG